MPLEAKIFDHFMATFMYFPVFILELFCVFFHTLQWAAIKTKLEKTTLLIHNKSLKKIMLNEKLCWNYV